MPKTDGHGPVHQATSNQYPQLTDMGAPAVIL